MFRPVRGSEHALFGPSLHLLPCVVGFFLAVRTVTVLLAVRVFGAEPELGAAANVGIGLLFLIVVGFCTLGDNRRPGTPVRQLPAGRWVLLFLGFSSCSLLWSGSVSVANSAAYWSAMAADVAVVALLLQVGPLSEVADSLLQGFVWGACAVALVAWILPAQPDLRLGDEELLGPNSIGYLCGLAFFFAQYLLRESRRRATFAAIVLAVTMLRTLSKTTIVAFLVSQGFLLVRDRSISRRTKMRMFLVAVVAVAVFSGLLASYYGVYMSAGNQSETLTGRLGIWAYFLAEALRQPWIGHGFDSAWKVVPPFGSDQFQAPHAHDELLQQFYAYGVVGIVLFGGLYGSFFVQIRRMFAGPQRTWLFALLIFVLVRGTADTERFDLSLPLWGIVLFSRLAEEKRSTEAVTVPVRSTVVRSRSPVSEGWSG